MNRRDLVKAVSAHIGQETRQVDAVLKGFQDVVTAVVSKGEAVAISGFAKFAKIDRPARMGRNPATGAAIKIKASKKARITPMKAFKDAVMIPSQAPKLARGVWPLAPVASTAKAAPARATKAPAKKAATVKKVATAKKVTAAKKAPARTTTRATAAKKR